MSEFKIQIKGRTQGLLRDSLSIGLVPSETLKLDILLGDHDTHQQNPLFTHNGLPKFSVISKINKIERSNSLVTFGKISFKALDRQALLFPKSGVFDGAMEGCSVYGHYDDIFIFKSFLETENYRRDYAGVTSLNSSDYLSFLNNHPIQQSDLDYMDRVLPELPGPTDSLELKAAFARAAFKLLFKGAYQRYDIEELNAGFLVDLMDVDNDISPIFAGVWINKMAKIEIGKDTIGDILKDLANQLGLIIYPVFTKTNVEYFIRPIVDFWEQKHSPPTHEIEREDLEDIRKLQLILPINDKQLFNNFLINTIEGENVRSIQQYGNFQKKINFDLFPEEIKPPPDPDAEPDAESDEKEYLSIEHMVFLKNIANNYANFFSRQQNVYKFSVRINSNDMLKYTPLVNKVHINISTNLNGGGIYLGSDPVDITGLILESSFTLNQSGITVVDLTILEDTYDGS